MIKRSEAIFLGLLALPGVASAQVTISEIMFDLEGGDSDREWIEVVNNGSEDVDFGTWKLHEGTTNHGLSAVGDPMIPSGGYAVIADDTVKFKVDWPSYGGLLFDSAFSLNNTGETLTLRCCNKGLTDRDSVTYNATGGGAGDGLSLHRNGSSITAAAPSPGSGAVQTPQPVPPPIPPTPTPAPSSTSAAQPTEPPQSQKPQETSPAPALLVPESPTLAAAPSIVVQEERPVPKKVVQKKERRIEERNVPEREVDASPTASPPALVAAAGEALPDSSNNWLSWIGAGLISLLGALGAYLAGKHSTARKDPDAWEIIDGSPRKE